MFSLLKLCITSLRITPTSKLLFPFGVNIFPFFSWQQRKVELFRRRERDVGGGGGRRRHQGRAGAAAAGRGGGDGDGGSGVGLEQAAAAAADGERVHAARRRPVATGSSLTVRHIQGDTCGRGKGFVDIMVGSSD